MIYKRGKTYWYEFIWNNKRIRESAKTGNPRTARQIESARKTELAKGEVGIKDRPAAPTFADFSERFLGWMAAERAEKKNTIRFYRDRVRQLLRHDSFKKVLLDQIDEEMIAGYVEWRSKRTRTFALRTKDGMQLGDTFQPVSVACVNRDLATLRRVLHVARQWKLIPSVPTIRLLPGERTFERVIGHDEENLYLSAAPPLLRDFATIAIDTGMRPEEICRMRWECLKLEPVSGARFGYIHNSKGKTKWAKRNVSMTARVQALLNARYEAAGDPAEGWVFPGSTKAGHIAYSTIDSQHCRTFQKLNQPEPNGEASKNSITPFRLYDLRHTLLTRLGEAGTDSFTIQKIAGHSSILVSQRYVHPTPERLEDAFVRLEVYNRQKTNAKTRVEAVA